MIEFVPLTDVESVMAILSRISLFGGTNERQLESILKRLESGIVKPGEYVFKMGEDPFYIHILKSGRLELVIADEDRMIDVHQIEVGECFGEASIMSMHKHTASVIAREESEVMVLSRGALIGLRHEDIDLFALLMMNIARELARRLQLTDGMLLHYLREQSGQPA